jgi:hypothetical protein
MPDVLYFQPVISGNVEEKTAYVSIPCGYIFPRKDQASHFFQTFKEGLENQGIFFIPDTIKTSILELIVYQEDKVNPKL